MCCPEGAGGQTFWVVGQKLVLNYQEPVDGGFLVAHLIGKTQKWICGKRALLSTEKEQSKVSKIAS